MKSPFAIINEIIDSDDGFVRFHFSAHTKGALLYIASCYVVRTTIKAKLHFAAWLRLKTKPAGISWVLSFFLIGSTKNGIIRQQVKEQLQ